MARATERTGDSCDVALTNRYDSVCPTCVSITAPSNPFCPECATARPMGGWVDLLDERDPWLGHTLANRYLISQRLGVGGTARVYRVHRLDLPRRYALKIIDLAAESVGTVEELDERVRREISVLRRLRNPHVVPIHDVLRPSRRTVGILMGFAEGLTMNDWVRTHGRMPAELAIEVVSQLADGLEEAHSCGVVHRDVKPENIMLHRLPNGGVFVRIMDFGIAHVDGARTVTHGFIGTPFYASPEQISDARITAASDAYSIGATLYYALTGTPPYTRKSSIAVMRAHVVDPIPRLSDARGEYFSPDLEALVSRLLAKNPGDRPQSMADLHGDIARLRAVPSWSEVITSSLPETSDLIDVSETIPTAPDTDSIARSSSCVAWFPLDPTSGRTRLAGLADGRVVSLINDELVVTNLSPRFEQHFRIDFAPVATCIALSDSAMFVGTRDGRVVSDEAAWWSDIFAVPDGSALTACAASKDIVAIGTSRGDVFVRDGGTWALRATGSPVRALALSRSGRTLAVATWDRVLVIDLGGGEAHLVSEVNVSSLCFSDDELLLATADRESRIAVWGLAAGQPRQVCGRNRESGDLLALQFARDTLLGLCRNERGSFVVDLQCDAAHESAWRHAEVC